MSLMCELTPAPSSRPICRPLLRPPLRPPPLTRSQMPPTRKPLKLLLKPTVNRAPVARDVPACKVAVVAVVEVSSAAEDRL